MLNITCAAPLRSSETSPKGKINNPPRPLNRRAEWRQRIHDGYTLTLAIFLYSCYLL